jgi:luciferase family oxidoreductase group 1
MRLSVLDQSTSSKGRSQDAAIRESLELAHQCEALGYHRYWLSEHHNAGTIVGTAPEILMAAIAATTKRIRVGSAGVMLPHYSALKVAEQFRVLEAIAPGRIDLGVGRAPGSDRLTSFALNPNPANVEEHFPAQIHDLQDWISGTPLPPQHPFHRVTAHPTGPSTPDLWILGSSDYGAQLAAHFGLPYAFAYFFSETTNVDEVLALYRDRYQPSARYPQPTTTICVWALAADTEAEARRQFRSRELWRVGFEKGLHLPLVSPEEAARREFNESERAILDRLNRRAIIGSAPQVAAKLKELATRLSIDELVINTWTFDPAARLRSYELLAGEFQI